MKITVLGAGETGKLLAQQLSQRQHKITLVDVAANLLTSLSEVLEVSTVCGNGCEASVLQEAQAGSADLLLAVTNNQYVNLLAGSIAKGMGAKKAIAKVNVPMQDSQEFFDYKSHFGLDYVFSSEQLAAAECYKYLLGEEATGVEQVGRGRITIQTVTVSSQSKLTGSPILSLKLPADVRLAIIHRNTEVIIPKGHHTLEAEDKVTLFGDKKQVEELAQSLSANQWLAETKKITIYGGTDYGLALAELLQDKRFKVRIFEKDPAVCGMLSKKLPNTVVIQGDGRSLSLLREEQVDGTDFYIGASMDDEDNIMACLQANSIGG
ncbi:MAG: NAD-binding protein, partial [Verrucomicrobiae bacterium]|nr:NAD-binding protein [Verrucomicrobiae bacterium]